MRHLLCLLSFILLSSPVFSAETLIFKQTIQDHGPAKKSVWTSETKDGITIIRGENFQEKVLIKARNNDAFYWNTKSKDGKTFLTVTKDKDAITMEGTLKNKKMSKKIKNTGQSPWHPVPGIMLTSFARSTKQKKELYIFSSDDKKLIKLIAKKAGKKEVVINNKTYTALHIELAPPGFKAMFWKAHLYYDTITGRFIKYSGLFGPPGSPHVTLELTDFSTH